MTDLAWLTARPIAHRGLHDLNTTRWENTLSAFDAAAKKNYAIECDVHLTADGEVVVFHDDELKRLTGEDGFVWQKSAAELSAMRIGGTEDRIPTLAQMLQLFDSRVPIVIELKGIAGHDDGLVAKVEEALACYDGKAAIMSFDHWLVRAFPKQARNVPSGLTAMGTKPHEIEAHFSILPYVSFCSFHVNDLPNPFVTFIREKLGLPVITWTVRDEAAVDRTRTYADQMTFEGFEP